MRDKIRIFTEKHPIVFCFIILLFYCGIYIFYHNQIQPNPNWSWDISFLKLAICFLSIIFMKEISNGNHKFGFTTRSRWKNLILLWPMSLFFIQNIMVETSTVLSGMNVVMYSFFMVLVENMVTGLYEEVGIRGIMVCHLMRVNKEKKNGIRNAVLISSLLFGSIHINNIVRTGPEAIIQCVYATAMGIIIAAIYVRTRNLWLCSILHGLLDLTGAISEMYAYPGEPIPDYQLLGIKKFAISNMLYLVIIASITCTVAGLYMIRKEKRTEILALWDDNCQYEIK